MSPASRRRTVISQCKKKLSVRGVVLAWVIQVIPRFKWLVKGQGLLVYCGGLALSA